MLSIFLLCVENQENLKMEKKNLKQLKGESTCNTSNFWVLFWGYYGNKMWL